MPPLDVLMVWHAFILNPRCFLEDCYRVGKIDFWRAGLPWSVIDSLIDNDFDYNLPITAINNFQTSTNLSVENLDFPDSLPVNCPICSNLVPIPITNSRDSTGYADSKFFKTCPNGTCQAVINIDTLSRAKFLQALDRLTSPAGTPLPGTILDKDGKPNPEIMLPDKSWMFPNQFCIFLQSSLRTCGSNLQTADLNDIKVEMNRSLENRKFLKSGIVPYRHLDRDGKISFRRMMSRFWSNPSPFSIHLVGAVIRQGTFVEKMAEIDWLHSPAIVDTIEAAVKKFERFMDMIKNHPGRCVVPTLNVDLVWHTLMGNPSIYWKYSLALTGKLVGHDDKIDEAKLGEAFKWTCEKYEKLYREPYSECMPPSSNTSVLHNLAHMTRHLLVLRSYPLPLPIHDETVLLLKAPSNTRRSRSKNAHIRPLSSPSPRQAPEGAAECLLPGSDL
ncbi:hypothetical protein HOY82DRAFT_582082 [Tuber indicum]|nr:hypothetical protein HOY82DRAFT_582082 [Tuber indicum]